MTNVVGQATRDRALYSDGGPMGFMSFGFGIWHNVRPGGATRGKWRIPDGKVGERSVVMFRALKVVAPTCVDQGPRRLGPEEQALIMYWHIRDLWGPANRVALMVTDVG
jgi:hypothetical protein